MNEKVLSKLSKYVWTRTVLVLSLLTNEHLLIITNPFVEVNKAYLHYHFSNISYFKVEE